MGIKVLVDFVQNFDRCQNARIPYLKIVGYSFKFTFNIGIGVLKGWLEN